MFIDTGEVVVEKWVKPPKLVKYENARLLSYNGDVLVCNFQFPLKYANNPFYINGKKILDEKDMIWGKRFFFKNRFYSLLEYYSIDDKITAYYIDVVLPPIIKKDIVLITDLKIDFWIMPDKKNYIILDEDELEEAIKENYFGKNELNACYRTMDFIKNKLEKDNFEGIFTDYETSGYEVWGRYEDLLLKGEI